MTASASASVGQRAAMRIPRTRPKERAGGDRGIDGTGWFKKPDGYGKIVASVKGGPDPNPDMVRDLVGTIESEKADMGVFATLNGPTLKTRQAATAAGTFRTHLRDYPKVQIWTAKDYFEGRLPDLPGAGDLPRAPRMAAAPAGAQSALG